MNWLSSMINSQPKRRVDNGNLPKEKRATGLVYHCPNEEKQRLSDIRHLEAIGNQTLTV